MVSNGYKISPAPAVHLYHGAGLSANTVNGYCNVNVITVDGLSALLIFP